MAVPQRRQLVDFENKLLPVSQQAVLLEVSRSSLYYKHVPSNKQDMNIKQSVLSIDMNQLSKIKKRKIKRLWYIEAGSLWSRRRKRLPASARRH